MNIDLIIKLARLANENPNENEANLAARKVCSLIKAGNYKFDNQPIINRQQPINREPVRPNRQPDVRSASNPINDIYDMFNKYCSYGKTSREYYSRPNYNKPPKQEEPVYVFWDELDPNTKKQKEESKRILKCKTCHKNTETSFVGLAEIFECNDCSWSEWERKKTKI